MPSTTVKTLVASVGEGQLSGDKAAPLSSSLLSSSYFRSGREGLPLFSSPHHISDFLCKSSFRALAAEMTAQLSPFPRRWRNKKQ
jgi:hypothetical protein